MLSPHRFYYLHNFQRALAWVGERYGDLLEGPERDFLAQFAQLPQPSQALLVRLLMRQGPWFRASKLVYEEIGDVEHAAAPLLALGWLDAQHPLGLEELFALHTKAELLQLFAQAPVQAGMRKAEMLQVLQGSRAVQQPYVQWHAQAPSSLQETAWRVTVGSLGHICVLVGVNNKRRPSQPSPPSRRAIDRDGCDDGDGHCLLLWSRHAHMP